jgi:hypothetical protein
MRRTTVVAIVIVLAACAPPKTAAPVAAQPAPCPMVGTIYSTMAACMTAKPAPVVAPLAPCTGDSTIYTYADTVLGVHPALVTGASVPPLHEFHGAATVRVLVASDGHVVRDSTKIVSTTNQAFASTFMGAVQEWTFSPASRNGCAVAFWYGVSMNR